MWGDIINSASIIYDMTYDYSTGTLYAISYDKSINKSELLVFDTQHKTGRAIKGGLWMRPITPSPAPTTDSSTAWTATATCAR